MAFPYVPITNASWVELFFTVVTSTYAATQLGGILFIAVSCIAIFKIVVGYFM